MSNKKLIRLQFDISQDKLDELETMMRKTGLSNRKELINNALTLLDWAIKQKEQGRTIASFSSGDKIWREMSMPILDNVHSV